MIKKIEAERRHLEDFGWLQARWLFSFSNYYDPSNVQFGTLRVFNDDIIQPDTGFDMHPHRDMEIVSIVLEGELTHQDSMGNKGVIKAGEIQRMTAGKGILHSEHNRGKEPVHLFQIWIIPDEEGLEPSYDQKDLSSMMKKNELVSVVSGTPENGAIRFYTDSTIYLSELENGKTVEYPIKNGRGVFLYMISGKIKINGESFEVNDQARITDETSLHIDASDDASFIMVDVPDSQ